MKKAPHAAPNGKSWLDGTLFVLFIAALMSNLSLSLDIILPVMPQISAEYQLGEPTETRVLLTIFVFAFGFGQIFMGVLSDRFGRRPVLGASLALYMLATALCAMAPTFEMLILGRFVQGLAAAGPRVIGVAIVRDRMSGARMAQTLSTAATFFMIAPIIAPFLGEIAGSIAGWQAVFALLFVFALPVWAVVQFALPETCPPENRVALAFATMKTNLAILVRTPQTLGNATISMMIYGAMFGFIGVAPFIYRDVYGVTTGFAAVMATFGFGVIVAAYVNSRTVVRLGPARVQFLALLVLTATALFCLALNMFGDMPLWQFHLCVTILMFTKGLIYSNTSTLAVDPHPGFAGLASSVVGGFAMLGSAGIAQIIGSFYRGNVTGVAVSYAVIGLLATLISVRTNHAPYAPPSAD